MPKAVCTCFPIGSPYACGAPTRCALYYVAQGPKALSRRNAAKALEEFQAKGGKVTQCDAKPARYAKTPQRRKSKSAGRILGDILLPVMRGEQ